MNNRSGIVTRVLCAVAIAISAFAWMPTRPSSASEGIVISLPQDIAADQAIVGEGTAAPTFVTPALSDVPPQLSEEQMTRMQAALDQTTLPGPDLTAGQTNSTPAEAAILGSTAIGAELQVLDNAADTPSAPGDYRFFRSVAISDTAQLLNAVSSTNEPSADARNDAIFMTGNWYASLSSDRGRIWRYVNPYDTFPADDGGFCCDQVVIYDRSRDLMFWLLQYVQDGTDNRQRLAVIRGANLDANTTASDWYYYDFTPSSMGLPASGRWFDYPKMALSNNFLYINTNVFNMNTPATWTNAALWRIPLGELATGGTINYQFLTRTDTASFMPVDGATDILYWGAHNTQSQVRIYRWAENSTSYSWDNVNIGSWSNGPMTCTTPDGRNPCGRTDGRMLAGWRSGGVLGFMWTAGQDGDFPFPYVNVARFNESNRSLIDQPRIWNGDYAWIYPSIGVNARGHLAGSVFVVGGSNYPQMLIFVDDDFNGNPAPWENYFVRGSTHGPASNRWGDYVASRRHEEYANTWISTGFTLQGGSINNNTHPQLVWHGRERDTPPSVPSNDDFSGRANVDLISVFNGNTTQATTAVDDPIPSCGSAIHPRQSKTVWFTFTPPTTSSYTFDTEGSSYDTLLTLWTGPRGGLSQLGCDDDGGAGVTSMFTRTLSAGTPIYVEVAHLGAGGGGTLTLDVTRNLPFVPQELLTAVISKTLRLTWLSADEDVTYYSVERRNGPLGYVVSELGPWAEITTTTQTTFEDAALHCSQIYGYRVRTYRGADNAYSDYTPEITHTVPPCTLYLPTLRR